MNITLINADSIFWEADKNLRLVNFNHILDKVNKVCTPDQIYFIGGLEAKDPFNESLKDIIQKCQAKGIEIAPVSSITKIDKHHNPELVMLDILFRGVLMQKARKSNTFTIVSTDASSVRSANFLADKGLITPVNYILSDCIADMSEIYAQNVVVKDTISLKAEDKTIEDKLAIRAIMEQIQHDAKKDTPYLNTTSILTHKCQSACGISPIMTRPLILSLIHHGYLTRQKFVSNGIERTGIVLGEKANEIFAALNK